MHEGPDPALSTCYLCHTVAPEGGLRMTETGEQICRWILPCAAEIARRHLNHHTLKGNQHA